MTTVDERPNVERAAHRGAASTFLRWMFRNRRTGRITVMQVPNWQLALWLVATLVLRLGHPHGGLHTVVRVIATAALLLWAGDEVVRGVNPFRRLVGAVVLAFVVASLVGLR